MNRKKILDECISILNSKIDSIQLQLNDLRTSAESESKSTSGDKHETGRAMIHLEQEQLTKQLGELSTQMSQVLNLKIFEPKPNVHSGSIVKTDKGNFFFGIAIGKIQVDNTSFMAISLISPLGKLFSGKRTGDQVTFNDTTYFIEEIL